ncbi:MAG: hypothetical protein H0W61_10905 [Bacteroidetes bacterium]|nr:hypothetical protein [Bacteroidota bacterium]
MKRSIFKPIIAGVLIGSAAFFMPFFLLKAVFFFVIIGSIVRMVMWRRYYGGAHRYQLVNADKIRSMSEEEYTAFKNKMNSRNNQCGSWQNHHCYERPDWKDCDSKCEGSSEKEKENKTGKQD